ncbi:MAG: alkaline phosphatase D family protein [Kofleriaceae bacterium]
MLTRRGFLIGSAAVAACRKVPTVSSIPRLTHGLQVGDVESGRALVWARANEASRLIVEWDTTDKFETARVVAGNVVTPDTGLATTLVIDGLPDGQTIFVRGRFEREAQRGASDREIVHFQTPRADKFRVAWTGDTCGQGYGRNPEFGGLVGYKAMREAQPAMWIHSGDMIYADNPIPAEMKVGDRVWKNVTNEHVARVAQTLDDFRARYQYTLDDEHARALAGEVPIVAQWDDHEIHNNWWPHQNLAAEDNRYTIQPDASVLASYARQAMMEWTPVPPGPVQRVIHYGPLLDIIVLDCRSFRTVNPVGTGDADMLGAQQVQWFIDAVTQSKARWKLIACDQPLSCVIGDGPDDSRNEGWADGDAALHGGRERELAKIFAGIRGHKNLVWITADVHYAAAHHYDPTRATVTDFDPFHEFIVGPIHAGSFGPNKLDPTFGPDLKFQWAPDKQNAAPWDGFQSFGTIDVSPEALQCAIVGIDGKPRYTVDVPFTA